MRHLLISIFAAAAATFSFAAAASAQDEPAILFGDTIRLASPDIVHASGPVERNQPVLSFAFEYIHTGVMQNDARGNGRFAQGTLYVSAGSPGYMVGRYGRQGTSRPPIWCFFASGQLNVGEATCLWLVAEGSQADTATVIDFIPTPFLMQRFEMDDGHYNLTNAPIIEERAIALPAPLRAEYRFINWSRGGVVLAVRDGERERGRAYITPNAQGQVLFPTVAGTLLFTRDGGVTTVTEVP